MANSEIIIKPKELEGEIQICRDAGKNVNAAKTKIEFEASKMTHLTELKTCGEELNKILDAFKEMIDNDMLSVEKVKGEWMGVDEEMATKTFGDVVKEFFTGK